MEDDVSSAVRTTTMASFSESMVVPVIVSSQEVLVMVDTGATHNVMAPDTPTLFRFRAIYHGTGCSLSHSWSANFEPSWDWIVWTTVSSCNSTASNPTGTSRYPSSNDQESIPMDVTYGECLAYLAVNKLGYFQFNVCHLTILK
jgi:hypothetical protein